MTAEEIKNKLSLALNSKNTISFLKNNLNANGLGLSNSTPNVNRFLCELTEGNDDIKIINKGNKKRFLNDIKIYDKRILVRTNSINGANKISFKGFAYEKEDNIDCKEMLKIINEELSYYDYIFLIRIAEEYEEKKIKVCYHYYLFSSESFIIKGIEEMDIAKHRKRTSYSSAYWTLGSFNNFYFKYSEELMNSSGIWPPFVNC